MTWIFIEINLNALEPLLDLSIQLIERIVSSVEFTKRFLHSTLDLYLDLSRHHGQERIVLEVSPSCNFD